MKYAWIEDDRIRDICPGDPATSYTPDIALHYGAQVPDNAENGDGWNGAMLVKPVPSLVLPKEREPEPDGYTLGFTASEYALYRLCRGLLELARKV